MNSTKIPENASIYQIFYNDQSRQALDPGFIPLDNSAAEDNTWFEFHPILHFLRTADLKENHWYGFLSPKFTSKTGLNSAHVHTIIEKINGQHDVLLLSHAVDQIIWFDDLFVQGDFWHAGLAATSKKFVEYAEIKQIDYHLSHSRNSCFSNFVIAKKEYWTKWLQLAQKLVDFVENNPSLNSPTTHRDQPIAMKVFLQERLVSLVLLDQSLKPFCLPLEHILASYSTEMKEILIAMDVLKREYTSHMRMASFNAFKDLQERFIYQKSSGLTLK